MRFCFNFRAGIFVYSLAFLSGVLILQQYSVLPARIHVVFFSAIYLICSYFLHKSSIHWRSSSLKKAVNLVILIFLLVQFGFIKAFLSGERAINNRFDDAYAGQSILIKGRVASIPVTTGKSQRFEFIVENHHFIDGNKYQSNNTFSERIRLSWYEGNTIAADERWQFEVRLKPPYGFMNPGGFDYEKWLFQKGISATGYITKSNVNRLLNRASANSINRFRQSISSQLDKLGEISEYPTLSLVKALAIGDKSSMSEQQWQVLTNTGTSHLMAISGLHIGLAALFANVVVRRSVPGVLMKYIPAQHAALVAGVFMGLLYALVAGLSVPTQRALIMLTVLSILLLLRRNHRPLDALGFALVIILLFDPLAILSAGFWFSFSAVAAIFISLTSSQADRGESNDKISIKRKILKILKHWLHLQLVISVFLLPLSLFMFQQVSLVSPLANLFLIPFVSFFVVPVVLLGILFFTLIPDLSNVFFILAAQMLDIVWPILSSLSVQPFSLWHYSNVGIFELLISSSALVSLYYSKRLSKKLSESLLTLWIIRSFLLVILFSSFIRFSNNAELSLKKGEIKLTVLDVGQGSSAVIQTQNHVMVFDAGAKFGSKLDTGKHIVIPFLQSENINALDRLVISHGDADHIGGAQSLLDEYDDVSLIGQNIETLQSDHKQLCNTGIEWQWDGVRFRFLSPEIGFYSSQVSQKQSRNNHSCVLQVRSPAGSILLTGDIEKPIEKKLLNTYKTELASDVLIVPHHGSDTSSIMPFINAVRPEISIISVGYRNRYRLPNHRVLKRYSDFYNGLNDRVLQTYSSGAISITLKEGVETNLQQFRKKARKYWHY